MSVLNSNALCTRKQVKDYLKITGSESTSDNLLNDLINRISTAFQSFCGRNLNTATYTEYYDGGCYEIWLDNYPIQSIAEVNDDSDWAWNTSTLVPSADYIIADERSIYLNGLFGRGRKNIKITYTAGYDAVPEDIRQSCIEEVGRKFKHRTDFDETGKTLDDGSVTYQDGNFPPDIDPIAAEVSSTHFYSRTFTIDHQ